MKLSLSRIFKEAEEDLEAWSRAMEEDEQGNVPGSQLQQAGAQQSNQQTNVGNVWGGISLPGDPAETPNVNRTHRTNMNQYWKQVDQAGAIDTDQIAQILSNVSAEGRSLNSQDIALLRQYSPGGDLENLMMELGHMVPDLYNELLDLGIQQAVQAGASQFKPSGQSSLKPATKPQPTSASGASWEQLAQQNPGYAAALAKKQAGQTLSGIEKNLLAQPSQGQGNSSIEPTVVKRPKRASMNVPVK